MIHNANKPNYNEITRHLQRLANSEGIYFQYKEIHRQDSSLIHDVLLK